MKLKSIFVDNDTSEGLYSVSYTGRGEDEFTYLMGLWTNPMFVTGYLIKNKNYLIS